MPEFITAFFADFRAFAHGDAWASLATLTALELVLGIDNIVFLSIVTGKLPPELQPRIRRLGLGAALLMRIALLFAISWVMGLKDALFTVPIADRPISGRDAIMIGGGLFLLAKSTHEIYAKLEVEEHEAPKRRGASFVPLVILQIMIIDMVFSLDSIVTAVGMAKHLAVMVSAMVLAVLGMMVFAGPVGDFVNRHPSMKILALSFLLLIGVLLVAEGFGQHIDRGYVYFAMGFSVVVELINMKLRRGAPAPVKLHGKFEEEAPGGTPAHDAGR
jgi:predicted tellurium resistance membrane protein TerC